jgi:hypothetical protein
MRKGSGRKIAKPIDFGLLRPRRKRPCSRGTDECDECASFHRTSRKGTIHLASSASYFATRRRSIIGLQSVQCRTGRMSGPGRVGLCRLALLPIYLRHDFHRKVRHVSKCNNRTHAAQQFNFIIRSPRQREPREAAGSLIQAPWRSSD